jgi:hypothetical protein
MNDIINRFTFVQTSDSPAFHIAPWCTRMTASYEDRNGLIHIFTDAYDPGRKTPFDDPLDSWEAVQQYYTTKDFREYQSHGTVVDKGSWTGDPATSDIDCVGAPSPGVALTKEYVLLFYAGKGPAAPTGPFKRTPNREDLPGRIMLAVAHRDKAGAADGPFRKQGAVIDYGAAWRSIRHDDPCPVVTDKEILLFFKGIGPGKPYSNRAIGLARTSLDTPFGPYSVHPEPVLQEERGFESPRVFRIGDIWHMFVLRYAIPGSGRKRSYGHYVATEPTSWSLVNDDLYVTSSNNPGHGGADMCPIRRPFNEGPPAYAFANRLDTGEFGHSGVFKQWLYRIEQIGGV